MPKRIQVIERAGDILDCFTPQRPELGVTEISRMIDLLPATVSRILLTLQSKGLVYANPLTRKYSIGPRIIQLAQIGLGRGVLRDKALPHMRRLRDRTGETVALAVRIGFDRTFIEQVEGTHQLSYSVQVGKVTSLHAGAAGKALLAFMPDKEIEEFLSSRELTRFTEDTITDPARLRTELSCVRDRGFATSSGEVSSLSFGVAAPIRDHTAEVVVALNIEMPKVRYDPSILPGLVGAIAETARDISAELGHF